MIKPLYEDYIPAMGCMGKPASAISKAEIVGLKETVEALQKKVEQNANRLETTVNEDDLAVVYSLGDQALFKATLLSEGE